MIRALAMIAVAGAVVSVATLSAAVAITGPDAVLHGAWSWGPNGWGDHESGSRADDEPQTTREIAWTGGDALDVGLSADVRFTQAAGPAKITLYGPRDAVDDVEIKDGHIQYRTAHDDDTHLTIVMTAPSVTRFDMEDSGKLDIAQYRQDALTLNLRGDADAAAAGEAKSVQLNISGSGDADLAALKTGAAKIDIQGSGDATLAPTDSADVNLSGSGDVKLLTHPAKLQSNLSGSGRILQKDGETD